MESEWELDRVRLYQMRRQHSEWTLQQLADAVGHCLSWVKKWLKRFREAEQTSLEMFKSRSRAPRQRPREVVRVVRDAILSLRDGLKERYGRVVGPKTILYHLHRDPVLQQQGLYVPRSTRTIWQVLKEGGRIPTRVGYHHPIERPAPMQHWEMDFGQISNAIEFLTVVDRGTSILVDTQTQTHFDSESALLAVTSLFIRNGLPQKLRFDNDPRFVGNWLADRFPSPLMQFLLCLGVEPDLVEPGKPQHKPFAERSVRTLKYESLYLDRPGNWIEAGEFLDLYRHFYNHERANQSLACGNRPPYEAFPQLPELSHIPQTIDPDRWLQHYHNQIFRRRADQSGRVTVGHEVYLVGNRYARQRVAFCSMPTNEFFSYWLVGP